MSKLKKVLSFLMALVTEMLLVALGAHLLPQSTVPAATLFWVFSGLLCTLFVINLTAFLRGAKRITSEEFLKQHQTILDASEQAKIDPNILIHRMEASLWGVRFYYVMILLLTGGIVFFASTFSLEPLVVISVICSYILWGLFQMLLQVEKVPLPDYPLSPDEYPALYEMVEKVRTISGIKMPVRLFLGGNNASVAVVGNEVIILLAAQEASILTRDEMTQVLLHELAHVANQDSLRLAKYQKVLQRWDATNFDYITWPGTLMMTIPTALLQKHCALYLIATSSRQEQAADQLAMESGDPQHLVNALAKINMLEFFREEPCRELGFDYYEREAPDPHFNELVLAVYHKRLAEREETWRGYLQRQLPARIDSHPIFRHRMENLNVSSYSVHTVESDLAYLDDIRRMREKDNQLSYDYWTKNWDNAREEHRSQAELIEKFQNNTAPYEVFSCEELYDMALAFAEIDHETALAILDHVLFKEPLNSYALSLKGGILLTNDDDTGTEFLFKAAELSVNYIDSYMDAIGDYALKTGNQELLERFREASLQLTTKNMDWNNTMYGKNKAEHMLSSDLNPELFETVRSYIIETGKEHLAEVLTVKKVIGDDHVFMYYLIFKDNTPPEDIDKVGYDIFRYLDMSDEQFYLEVIPAKSKTYKQLKQWIPDCTIYQS